jgi:hypothetical protein
MSVQVHGVKEALRELNKTSPTLRRAFTKDYKAIVKPVIDQAKAAFPNQPPLRNMVHPYKQLGGWDGGMVAKGVVAKINTRKARNRNAALGASYETVGTFIIQQKTGWGSLYDMAGKKNSSTVFVSNLTAKFGGASRAMWPAYESNAEEVNAAVLDLVGKVMAEVGRNVITNGD